jgi:hypothetical protein
MRNSLFLGIVLVMFLSWALPAAAQTNIQITPTPTPTCPPPAQPANPDPPHGSTPAPWDVQLSWNKGINAKNLYAIDTEVPEGYSIVDGVLVEGEFALETGEVTSLNKISEEIPGERLINFDDVSAPCLFKYTIRLTNEYGGRGVIFEGPGGMDGGAIVNQCGNFSVSGHSSPNFLAFNSGAILSDGGKPENPETIHFLFPVSSVHILAGSNSDAGKDITMEAYNSLDALMDSDTITLNSTLAPLSVSGYGITRVVISTDASIFILDDLRFTDICPETYDVYFGTDNPPETLLCENITGFECAAGDLVFNTTYFWRVIARNDTGETSGPVWSFFIPNYLWLQAESAAMDTGMVTLEDLSTPPTGWYEENTTATVYAVPICGYKFDRWSGDLSGSENPAEVVMDGDKNIVAHFSECSIIVPDDYATIQKAIDSVQPLDKCEIIVQPDTYNENIYFKGKNIILRSTDPLDPAIVAATIIDGDFNDSVVTFNGTETECSTLAGFTIMNGASIWGGGVNGWGTHATIHNNVITSNTVTRSDFDNEGGGVTGCDGNLLNNVIKFNSAFLGGGLSNCNGTIANCVIAYNSAEYGGGLAYCGQNIWNSTIYGNSASLSGGGLQDCYANIWNCIIWGNAAPSDPQIASSPNPLFSCIEDWAGGGVGNIKDNPELVDPGNSDFHLKITSPCIDAGTAIMLDYDFEGDPRMHHAIYWMTRGDGSFVDMGADEFIGNVPFGDPPQLMILTPSRNMELTTDTYRITWIDEDLDDDTPIDFYYDIDNTGVDGDLITTGVSEDSEIDLFDWNLGAMPEGIYWIYGVIDDGKNLPVISYSPGSLMVSRITVEELKNHLLGIEAILPERIIFADFNRDGAIDVADLIFLLSWNKK